MKIGPTLTPAALRTRYHEHSSAKPAPGRRIGSLPDLAAETDVEASDEWLAHVRAGRIAVR